MKLVSFVAGSAADALAEIQRRLGPDAVVVSVRPVSFWNISRLWRKNCKIEVTAGVPDKTSAPKPDTFSPPGQIPESAGGFASGDSRWRSVTWLEAMGLLPVHAERLQMHLRAVHGEAPPEPLEEEWQVVSRALSHFWLKPPPIDGGAEPRPHVFIGPPGSGKTTALCKWLTLASLLEERAARVWRRCTARCSACRWSVSGRTREPPVNCGSWICPVWTSPTRRLWTPCAGRSPGCRRHACIWC